MIKNRKVLYSGIVIVALVVAAIAWQLHATPNTTPATATAAPSEPTATIAYPERTLGQADAPITIIEYASITCSHCANFYTDTLPELKEKYIATGKAKLIYRDFPLDKVSFDAALVGRCIPEANFFAYLSDLFTNQDALFKATDHAAYVTTIAGKYGLDAAGVTTCRANNALKAALASNRLQAENDLGVRSTPTFFVNGVKLVGNQKITAFADIIDGKQP